MSILAITGATGFVGTALAARLRASGHRVLRFVRRPVAEADDAILWDPATGVIDRSKASTVDAVVHLAGESVAAGRWTAARKRAIRDSRGPVTERLCRTLAELPKPPVLVSASGVGIYGDRGDEVLDENSPRGQGFLADVAAEWEAGTMPLQRAGARVCTLRIGMVLGRGGALDKILPPFRMGLGGRLGSGRQWTSWIALDDLCAAIAFLLADERARGTFLGVAPNPVTNREFTAILARRLGRPAILPAPAFALRLVLGEMASALLLASQRAVPRRLLDLGFRFAHPALESALEEAFR